MHDENSTITLKSLLQDNKPDKTQANILQIDIENAEWEMLEGIEIGILAEFFTQVIFELHGCNPEEEQGFHQRITQLKRLNEFFCPIHLHLTITEKSLIRKAYSLALLLKLAT